MNFEIWNDPFLVAKVSFPLTLDSAFAHFFYSLIGAIKRSTIISYDWEVKKNEDCVREVPRSILLLSDQCHFETILVLIAAAPVLLLDSKKQLARMLYFTEALSGRVHTKTNLYLRSRGRRYDAVARALFEKTKVEDADVAALRRRKDVQKLLKYFLVFDPSPDVILRPIYDCFLRVLLKNIDPFKEEISVPDIPVSQLWERRTQSRGQGVKLSTFGFREEANWHSAVPNTDLLLGKHIGFFIAGRKGSGKSTMLTSLFLALQEAIARLGIQSLSSMEIADVDFGSRTTNLILAGEGREEEYLQLLKHPWNRHMAHLASLAFFTAKQRRSIVLADLPGKAPDEIFKVIGSSGDLAIVLAENPADISEWTEALASVGVRVVAEVHTERGEKADSSFSVAYESDTYIKANHVVLPRRKKGITPFVWMLAHWLLLIRFPHFIAWQEEEMSKKATTNGQLLVK